VIGAKSLTVVGVAAVVLPLAAARGLLGADHLSGLSAASCVAVGLFAALSAALVAAGWHPEQRSRAAVGLRGGRPVVEVDPAAPVRELPGAAQRALITAVLACVGLAAFGNQATARLAGLPHRLAEPSPSEFCPEEEEAAAPEAPPPALPPAEEQPGCALIKRAFELGYAKDLGDCAPRQVAAPAAPVAAQPAAQPCTLRQRDEPFLHYTWRRLAGRAGGLSDAHPAAAVSRRIDTIRTKLDYLDELAGRQIDAVSGRPHAAHHLWVNLPAPHPASWLGRLVHRTRCADRFAELPVWPDWDAEPRPASALVEHALGQLLFDRRFSGTVGNCDEYTIHWDAPADACQRLADDPTGFLAGDDALESVRAVLGRHRRALALRRLAVDLGGQPRGPEPPPPRALVSLQCLIVDPAGTGVPDGRELLIDGDGVPVRELRVAAIRTAGAGPIDVYLALAALLAGGHYSGGDADAAVAAADPDLLAGPGFLLTRLDQLHGADPFLGARWPLDRGDLVEVYPFRRHLAGFIGDFRRRYWAQRSRL